MILSDLLDRPIAFQRAFVSLGAGITGALMLSQAVYWSRRTDGTDGWFFKTMEEWQGETGMTRCEQEGARKKLVRAGVLEEQKKGVPCRLYYRVNLEAIAAALGLESAQTRMRKPRKPVCGKPAGKAAGNPRASVLKTSTHGCGKPAFLSKTTTETTEEITAESITDPRPAEPAKGGETSAPVVEPRCKIPDDMPGPRDPTCKTYRAWANYAMAYRKRYKAWPIWNARVAGQVGQLIDRLGSDVAHHVAAYFLSVNDARLINGFHGIGDLLSRAEAYHTQWATNTQMNHRTAQELEGRQANLTAAQRALETLRARRNGDADG
ncbi:helix-turn-helix domain-containing protein [Pseudomonas sp. USHLN015]|uniref:helix-turn-helix domain-containing protein n=1 Tax=Pseudomonas sp. USHLN015 TaxID=3081296 RepID=UPI00301D1E1B